MRSGACSAAVSEVEELLRVPPGGKDKAPNTEGLEEEIIKLRNIDTGEDIELAEIGKRVPPSLDPGELFHGKDVA